MDIELDYGRTTLSLSLPDGRSVERVEKQAAAPLASPEGAVRVGIERPIDAPPLRELAKGRRDAVIVISDSTRPVPNALLIPPLLDALDKGGLPAEAVTIQVATGLHRKSTLDELDEMLGSEIARSMRIVQHDARDIDSHRNLGQTSRGIPILIDRFFLDSDLRIITGLIEPHLMAGFSGGRKAVCPGLAAVETIRVAHGPAMLEGKIGPGIIVDNPLHRELVEVLRKVGVDFLVNVALDRERRVAGVFCGHPEIAHLAGIEFVESESHVALDDYADFVIASAGGHPLDASFYQAIKGISAASAIVRPGGVILLCASLSEGIGSPSFEKLIRETESPEDFEARLLDDQFFVVDQWMLQHLCQARRRARVLLYTDGLPFEAASELLVEAVRSPAEGIACGLDHIGDHGRIAALPQGPYVLASVHGHKRPLGGPAVSRGSATTR
ncbi:MAG: nickel-dependent lactate racemase [Myxococcota bacterium]